MGVGVGDGVGPTHPATHKTNVFMRPVLTYIVLFKPVDFQSQSRYNVWTKLGVGEGVGDGLGEGVGCGVGDGVGGGVGDGVGEGVGPIMSISDKNYN